jgi:hypothetical protein
VKIYILGDSFTDNLFKYEIDVLDKNQEHQGPIYDYVKLLRKNKFHDPLYFEDYLKLWGHEVINLGQGGCSNESIFHQFTQIKEPFDRIIINWTGFVRFDWYCENNVVRTFTGGMPPNAKLTPIDEILVEQGFNRENSKILRNKTLDFISFFIEKYKHKKPIIWSPFENISKMIETQKSFFWSVNHPIFKNIIPEYNRLTIEQETNGKICDQHYGRFGNFYTALIFNTILEYINDIEHDGQYIEDLNLFYKIEKKIKTSQHHIVDFNRNLI